jgi:hypothetical protein
MKLRPRDVISYQGRDFVVEGVLTYKLAGPRTQQLARAVDGDAVMWIEPLKEDADERLILFHEVSGLPLGTPPPPTIAYKGQSYLPRFTGTATVDVDGVVADRPAGTCELWRYRGGGDIYLQIEAWPGRTVVYAGESVHKDMIEIFPAP